MSTPSGTQPGSGDNIDLSQIPNEDTGALASAIETFYKQDGTVKSQLSRSWERNQMMLDGQQWLVWSEGASGGSWNNLTVSKDNEYIPRPVTNVMFHCYQTLKGYFSKTKPTLSVTPNDPNSFEDKSSAKLAELCIAATSERLKEQENLEYADSVALGYGGVFKKDYWDSSAGERREMPPAEPIDPMSADPLMPVEPEVLPIGELATSIIEPFRMIIDPLATDLHTARWLGEYAIQPLEWIRSEYSKPGVPGYTNLADTVKEESSLSGSMRRFYQLKNSSGVKGDLASGKKGSEGGSTELTNSAVVKEIYEAPSAAHPKGRMIVVANGVCLYAGDSPCEGPDAGDWHPYSDFRWELVPGRYWPKGPMDAICELQKRLNSIDATIILTRKTMAIPQKLVPKGSGIAPGSWTGRPGQQIDFNAEAGAPTTVPSAGVDPGVWKEREQVIEEMKMISGAMDILTGDRPPGVGAASAIALLIEMGTGKLFPMLDRKKRFIESSKKKQLRAIAKNYRENRPEFIAKMKQLNKSLPASVIENFIGSDLRDNCNVTIEVGSNVPKLEAMKQMRLMEAAQMMAIDLQTPVNRREFQRQMGIVGFDNDVGPDMTRAEWENDCLNNLLANPERKPVVLQCDDDQVHIQTHERRMKEPVWMELDPAIQQAYMVHVEEHNSSMMQKQQMQAMNDMAMGQSPQPQGSAGDPTATKSQGKGAPSSVREEVMSADLPPGGDV